MLRAHHPRKRQKRLRLEECRMPEYLTGSILFVLESVLESVPLLVQSGDERKAATRCTVLCHKFRQGACAGVAEGTTSGRQEGNRRGHQDSSIWLASRNATCQENGGWSVGNQNKFTGPNLKGATNEAGNGLSTFTWVYQEVTEDASQGFSFG